MLEQDGAVVIGRHAGDLDRILLLTGARFRCVIVFIVARRRDRVGRGRGPDGCACGRLYETSERSRRRLGVNTDVRSTAQATEIVSVRRGRGQSGGLTLQHLFILVDGLALALPTGRLYGTQSEPIQLARHVHSRRRPALTRFPRLRYPGRRQEDVALSDTQRAGRLIGQDDSRTWGPDQTLWSLRGKGSR